MFFNGLYLADTDPFNSTVLNLHFSILNYRRKKQTIGAKFEFAEGSANNGNINLAANPFGISVSFSG